MTDERYVATSDEAVRALLEENATYIANSRSPRLQLLKSSDCILALLDRAKKAESLVEAALQNEREDEAELAALAATIAKLREGLEKLTDINWSNRRPSEVFDIALAALKSTEHIAISAPNTDGPL